MTALFLVILINQWREQSNHLPALIGVLGSIVCLLLFGLIVFFRLQWV